MNHAVGRIDRARPWAALGRLPRHVLRRARYHPARLLRVARENHHLVALRPQLLAYRLTDQPRSASNDHALWICHNGYSLFTRLMRSLGQHGFFLFVSNVFVLRTKTFDTRVFNPWWSNLRVHCASLVIQKDLD